MSTEKKCCSDSMTTIPISSFWLRGGERLEVDAWHLKDLVVAEEEEEAFRRERKRIQYANRRVERAAVHGRKSQGLRPVVNEVQPVPSFREWLDMQEQLAQPTPETAA